MERCGQGWRRIPCLCRLIAALLLVNPAAALGHAADWRVGPTSTLVAADATLEIQKSALVISGLGPDSRFGCGVRELIFILDLQECGYRVDIVTEDGGSGSAASVGGGLAHEHFGWSTRTPAEAFRNMRWFNKTDSIALESYSSIFFFGWYWEFQMKGGEEGLESVMLPRLADFRSRTTLMLDDVPDVRCEEETFSHRSLAFCRNLVPRAVLGWTAVASRVFTLTEKDADMVTDMFKRQGIPDLGPVRVWPLRLRNLERVQQEERWAPTRDPRAEATLPEKRSYLTMVANDHSANREFTERIFSSGAARRWCDKALSLIFVGTIGEYVSTLKPFYPDLPSGCVITAGVQSRTVLAQRILPRTLAMLNPFWRDLRSGISVKSYEALAAGVPLVTSVHGLRGLESCGASKLALGMKEADDPAQYVDFVDRLLLDSTNYGLLTAEALRLRSVCMAQQEAVVAAHACGTMR